jgi:RNA polymerase sigma factor (sigma-70 family)
MKKKDNDIHLLHNNPDELLLKYIPVIEQMVINKLIHSGYFSYQYKDDIVQEVILGLLGDIEKIRQNFNGISSFRPYFIQIIINRCREIRRKEYRQEIRMALADDPIRPGYVIKKYFFRKQEFPEFEHDNLTGLSSDPERQVTLDAEIENLSRILKLYPFQKRKIIICLKVITDYQVTYDELKSYCKKLERGEIRTYMTMLAELENKTRENKFQGLIDFFNHCDKTNKKKDSLRKWLINVTAQIIELMNKDSGSMVYDKDNIIGLFVLYFDSSKAKIS